MTNLCSKECVIKLPTPPEDYVQFAHKGGADLEQPLDEDERFELEMKDYKNKSNGSDGEPIYSKQEALELNRQGEKKAFPLLKLIRKIWER